MTIKEKINKLNTAQVGSFGEYIFYSLCQDKKIKIIPYHKERTDFLLNEEKERIDVKTYRSRIDFEKPDLTIYNGVRIIIIKYAVVDFFKRNVIVTVEGKPIDGTKVDELNYYQIELLLQEWRQNNKKYNISNKELTQNPLYEEKLKEIKKELTHFFEEEGFKTYIIHRTDQCRWGKESPHNLLPQFKTKDGECYYRPTEQIRIFLDFNTSEISKLNLYQIIAYPEMRYKELPLIEKTALHWPKVDLEAVPENYVFVSIEDLKKNYKIKFGV